LQGVDTPRLKVILSAFPAKTVVVIGDVMSDEYIWGKVTRISPEAPIPVMQVTGETLRLGGAANVAANLRALGAQVRVVGVVGADPMGQRLARLMADKGIDPAGLVADPERPTIQKTRVVAGHQQIVRYDRERQNEISAEVQKRVMAASMKAIEGAQAIVFSDYAKGLLIPSLCASLIESARRRGLVTTADPKPKNIMTFKGVDLVSPNKGEAEAASGISIESPASLDAEGAKLLAMLQAKAVLITRSEEGMSLYLAGGGAHHVPTMAQEVFDVTGAGDTVISTLTLALAAGADYLEASVLSNAAAGIVVGEVGVATVTPAEIEAKLEQARA
jgi:D-beta-D-heptose 7-phosphate kinase/D-beta-D-heptose 1-phosphate adenosyltransferase